ncbi:MAG: hypothetical protein FWD65_08185 [Coriobacteriia bacterium]|nr:hypothetical protein [Coriobacteriia bacterium]
MLVAAVLRPHERVDVELGLGRGTTKQLDDLVMLVRRQSQLDREARGDPGLQIRNGFRLS